MYKAVFEMKELGSFENFLEAFKAIYDAVKSAKILCWQLLETTIWIEMPNGTVVNFYTARDMMCEEGYLVDGVWQDQNAHYKGATK